MDTTGDSFTIGSSALCSLRNFPRLQQEVTELGNPQPRILVHKFDGTVIRGPLEFKDILSSSVDPETAKSFLRLSRPKLYSLMLDQLERTGVDVEFGKEVVDYFEDETSGRAGVVLKDRSKHDADVVIAADGAHTHSNKLVLGRETKARPSGDAIFRTSYPLNKAMTNPLVAKKLIGDEEQREPMVHLYMGYLQTVLSLQIPN